MGLSSGESCDDSSRNSACSLIGWVMSRSFVITQITNGWKKGLISSAFSALETQSAFRVSFQ
jgi:hypothetical protein